MRREAGEEEAKWHIKGLSGVIDDRGGETDITKNVNKQHNLKHVRTILLEEQYMYCIMPSVKSRM